MKSFRNFIGGASVLAGLAFFLLPASAGQFHCTWNFSDFTGGALGIKQVTLQTIAPYGVDGSTIITGDIRAYGTGTNSALTVSNLFNGRSYRVRFIGDARVFGTNVVTTITNNFGTNVTGAVNAVDYLALPLVTDGAAVAYSQAAADGRFLRRTNDTGTNMTFSGSFQSLGSTNYFAGDVSAQSFSGNLNASELTTGTVPMARLDARVVTNANAALSGNQLTTGDGGRGIRSTNITATVLGVSGGVPYSATAAQIGGLFSGGADYLKADGTTGGGGSGGSVSTNLFHPDDYGALGDGTTVDDAAVSNAWRAAWIAGGVFSMEGRGKTYVVSNFCFTVVGSSPSTIGFSAPIFRGGGSILRHVGTNWLMRFTNACPDIEGLHVFATGNSPGGILILGPPSNGRLLSSTFFGYTNGTAIMAEGLTSWNVEAWAAYCYRGFGFGAYCDGSEMRLRADHCTFSVDTGCTNALWQYTTQGPVGGKWTIVGNYNGDCVLTPSSGVLEVNVAFESCTNAFISLGHNLARHGYDNTAQGAGTLMLNFAGGFGNPANGGVVPANWTNAPIELNCQGRVIGRGLIYGTGWTNGWFISRNAQADTCALQWEGGFGSFDMRTFWQLSTGERIKSRSVEQKTQVNQPFRMIQTDPTISSGYDTPMLSAVAKFAGNATDILKFGYAEDVTATNFAGGMRMYYSGGPQVQFTNVGLNIFRSSPSANQVLLQLGTSDDADRFSVDEDGDVTADGIFTIGSYFSGPLRGQWWADINRKSGILGDASGLRVVRENSTDVTNLTARIIQSTNTTVANTYATMDGSRTTAGNVLEYKTNNVTVFSVDANGTTTIGGSGGASGGTLLLQPNGAGTATQSATNFLGAAGSSSSHARLAFSSTEGVFGGVWSFGAVSGYRGAMGASSANSGIMLYDQASGSSYGSIGWSRANNTAPGAYFIPIFDGGISLTNKIAAGSYGAQQVGAVMLPQLTTPPTNAIRASAANNVPWTAANLTNVGPALIKTNSTSAAGGFTVHRIAVDSEYLAQLREEFFGGGNASFQIGELGWRNISGGNGTPGAIASEDNHPGIFRASTAGSANSYSGFALSQSTSQSGFVLSDGNLIATFIFRPSSTNNTDTAVGFGLPATHMIATASPNTLAWNSSCIAVVSTNGSPWYLHSRNASGGPESWTTTGVASQSAGWVKAKFRWDAANATMYLSVNDTAEVSVSGSSIPPTSNIRCPVFQIITSDTNARDLDADFFSARQEVTR